MAIVLAAIQLHPRAPKLALLLGTRIVLWPRLQVPPTVGALNHLNLYSSEVITFLLKTN